MKRGIYLSFIFLCISSVFAQRADLSGIKICIELIQQIREIEGVAGVHIMAIEWEDAVKPIVEGAGLLPRPIV